MDHTKKNKTDWNNTIRHFDNGTLYSIWGPRTVQIEPTNFCGAKCVMCDRWKWAVQNKNIAQGTVTLDEYKRLFKELRALGTRELIFSGGDPFLRKDYTELVNYAKKTGFEVSMFTNGYYISEEKANAMLRSNAHMSFSLDGSTAEIHDKIRRIPNGFNRAINILKYILSNRSSRGKPAIGVNFVVQHDNYFDLENYFDLMSKIGVDYVRFGLVHGMPNVSVKKNAIPVIAKQIKKIESNASKTSISLHITDLLKQIIAYKSDYEILKEGLPALNFFKSNPTPCMKVHQYSMIDAFGNVYPCTYAHFDNQEYTAHIADRNSMALGNIKTASFESIWNGKRYNALRKIVSPVTCKQFGNVCGQCEHYHEFKKFEELVRSTKTQLATGNNLPDTEMLDLYAYEEFITK